MTPPQHPSRTAAIWQFYTRSFSGKVVAESHREAVEKARRQHKIPEPVEITVDAEPVWKPRRK